jgi:hypothetical protein
MTCGFKNMSSFKTTTTTTKTKTKTTTYIMVMEKALPHLPEELVKYIEELAGIYRQPGYKELSESLKFLSLSNATLLLDRETFVPKPRGRPRKGKVWHPKKGCWVDNGLLLFRVGPSNPAHVERWRLHQGYFERNGTLVRYLKQDWTNVGHPGAWEGARSRFRGRWTGFELFV